MFTRSDLPRLTKKLKRAVEKGSLEDTVSLRGSEGHKGAPRTRQLTNFVVTLQR